MKNKRAGLPKYYFRPRLNPLFVKRVAYINLSHERRYWISPGRWVGFDRRTVESSTVCNQSCGQMLIDTNTYRRLVDAVATDHCCVLIVVPCGWAHRVLILIINSVWQLPYPQTQLYRTINTKQSSSIWFRRDGNFSLRCKADGVATECGVKVPSRWMASNAVVL